MKSYYRLSMFIAIMAFGLPVFSQQKAPNIAFKEKIYDFGKIKEEAGVVTHDFKFRNTGSQPLIIQRVVSSCGCTTPTWSKEPIPPGGEGFIRVAYNPRNRPNKFSKTITIYSNASSGPVMLRIMGFVEPRPKTVKDIYPYEIEGLRLKTNHIAFTRTYKNQKKVRRDELINTSDHDIKIEFTRVPPHLTLKAVPPVLKPNQKGYIEVTYDASKKNDWGFVIDRVWMKLNGKEQSNSRLVVSASIEQDFSKLTPEQRAKAPHISFKEKSYDFGKAPQRSEVEHEFVFTNTGKSDLVIHKVRSSCGCTAVSPKEKVIKPGQSSNIKAIFHTGAYKGRQSKSITVITNDPDSPTTMLRITGIVEPPAEKK